MDEGLRLIAKYLNNIIELESVCNKMRNVLQRTIFGIYLYEDFIPEKCRLTSGKFPTV